MKKIKFKDIITSGTLETVTNLYGQTSANGLAKLPNNNLRKLASNLLPIVESEWENGYIDINGNHINGNSFLRMKNMHAIPSSVKILANDLLAGQIVIRFYDASGVIIGSVGKQTSGIGANLIGTTPPGTAFFRAYVSKNLLIDITPKDIYSFGFFLTIIT